MGRCSWVWGDWEGMLGVGLLGVFLVDVRIQIKIIERDNLRERSVVL